MKNVVSCDAASKAAVLSVSSKELLVRASVLAELDLNDMGGTMLPVEVLWASQSRLEGCGWCWGSASACSGCH